MRTGNTTNFASGIRECQIIQWFVQPGARVEQFDKVCEVQSDKAAVEVRKTIGRMDLIRELIEVSSKRSHPPSTESLKHYITRPTIWQL